MSHVAYISVVIFWAATKNRCTLSVWGRTQVRSEIKSKVHHASPAIGPEYVVPYLGRIKPRYTRVGLLCLIFNRVCPFLTNQRPSIVPPCARMAWFGDPLHSSHPTPRHTSNTRICLHTSAQIHTTYGCQFAPWSQTAVHLHPYSR